MVPILRGCFHVACYAVYRAKDSPTALVGAAKSNTRIIDNDYLHCPGEGWENTLKTRNRFSREVDDETHRDWFWPRRFHEMGFVGRRTLTRQRQRSRRFGCLCGRQEHEQHRCFHKLPFAA